MFLPQVVQGNKMMEGAGVRICRTVGTSQLRNLDPFLMLVSTERVRNIPAAFWEQQHNTSLIF